MMETSLGFGHFLTATDGIARFILALMALMSIGTWYLIAIKGVQLWQAQRRSAIFLRAFWQAGRLAVWTWWRATCAKVGSANRFRISFIMAFPPLKSTALARREVRPEGA